MRRRACTWGSFGVVCTALPLWFVASCTSFGEQPRDEAGVEMATDATTETTPPNPGDAEAEAAKPDGARSCHEGDLLVNPGYEAAKCVGRLGGTDPTQASVPGHDSATACSICGSSTQPLDASPDQLYAVSPDVRAPPLPPGRYFAEAWVRSGRSDSDGGDAGSLASVALSVNLFHSPPPPDAVSGPPIQLAEAWTCTYVAFTLVADAGRPVTEVGLTVQGSVRSRKRECFEVDDFGIYPATTGFEPCTCH